MKGYFSTNHYSFLFNCTDCSLIVVIVDHANITFKAQTAVQLSPSLFPYVMHLLFPLIGRGFGQQLTEQYA
jgi:hypothetical protein